MPSERVEDFAFTMNVPWDGPSPHTQRPYTVERTEASRALAVLFEPDQAIQLQVFEPPGCLTTSAADTSGVLAFLEQHRAQAGTYFRINSVRNGLSRSATDKDVTRRRLLFIDADAGAAKGSKVSQSATDEEKAAAVSVADNVVEYLAGEGWPLPIIGDSGNGTAVYYRIDLPNDDVARDMVKRVLHHLGNRFDTAAAHVDRGNFNASRLAKLPGSWARKGKETTDRPHRMCRLLSVPSRFEVVSVDKMLTVAGPPEPPKSKTPPRPKSPWVFTAGSSANGERIGDHFDRAGPGWDDLLEPHGWVRVYRSGNVWYWRRPGKDTGKSATTGYCTEDGKAGADELFYVWTSNGHPFEAGKSYGKFRVFAMLNHGSDWSAAAKALAGLGYGQNGKHQGEKKQPAGLDSPPNDDVPVSRTGVEIITNYYRETYQPIYREGTTIVCADGSEVVMASGTTVATSVLMGQLEEASDAPKYVNGGIKRQSLPAFFGKWARIAWGDLLASLPDEDHVEPEVESPSRDTFRKLVKDAMLSHIVLGEVIGHGGNTQTERRSVVGWCRKLARSGPWSDIRSYRVWCKNREVGGGEIVLMIAIRSELFPQLKADRRLCELKPNTFSRRCHRYGVGESSRTDRPHGFSAVVLADEFVSELTATLADEDEVNLVGPVRPTGAQEADQPNRDTHMT